MKACVIYAAKSTRDVRGSIPDQLKACRELADRNDFTVMDAFTDEAHSAFHGNRGPGLERAMSACEALAKEHGDCRLIVWHTNRIARGDGKEAKHLLEYAIWSIKFDVKITSVLNPLPEDPAALLHVAAAYGQADHGESKTKSQNVGPGLRRRAERGQAMGGPPRYGYMRVFPEGRKDGRLERIDTEFDVIRRIDRDYLCGQSTRAIAKALTQEMIPTKQGARGWSESTIKSILFGRSGKFYCGVVFDKGGNEYPGEHEAVRTVETWEAIQRIRKSPARRKGGRQAGGAFLLTKGLLKCGKCGRSMRGIATRDVYFCGGREEWGTEFCDQGSVPREAVDGALMDYLLHWFVDLEKTARQNTERHALAVTSARAHIAERELEVTRTEQALGRIKRALQGGHLDPADYADQRSDLLSELEAAQRALAQATRVLERAEEATGSAESESSLRERMKELRVVGEGLKNPSDRNALRMMLAETFAEVIYIAPGHDWLVDFGPEEWDTGAAAVEGGAYLAPYVHDALTDEWLQLDLTDPSEDFAPFDPDYVGPPHAVLRRPLPQMTESPVGASKKLVATN